MSDDARLLRLKQQVSKLPRHDECWEMSTWLGRMWVAEDGESPLRPYMSIIVNCDGLILRSKIHEQTPTVEMLFEELLEAMKHPMMGIGGPGRPAVVYLDDADAVADLTPLLTEVEVGCEYRDSLPEIDEPRQFVEDHLRDAQEFIPGLVTIPCISDALLEHFYQLAAEYYHAMPWRWLTDLHPLEIRYPATAGPRYAVVMGSSGQVFGLSVYDSLAHLRTIYREDLTPTEVLNLTSSLTLYFEEAPSMSFDDLDAIAEHHWPIASAYAYPVLGRTLGIELSLPSLSDVIWMEGAIAGILAYLRDHKPPKGEELTADELTLPIETISGPSTVFLRYPAFDPWNA